MFTCRSYHKASGRLKEHITLSAKTDESEAVQHFHGIFDTEDLGILAKALDDYCREFDIPRESQHRSDAASLLLALFRQRGRSPEEIRRGLVGLNRLWDGRGLPDRTSGATGAQSEGLTEDQQ